MTMIQARRKSPRHLKLHIEDEPRRTEHPREATSSAIRGGGTPSSRPVRSRRPARELAAAIEDLEHQLQRAYETIKQREGELAAAVPVVRRSDQEPCQLASRLEAILRGGAQAVGCDAAALYVLDDATSHLKLRSHWGLPGNRYVLPPRPLCRAKGDLEALTGRAVVLDDTERVPHWSVPESFRSAVCVSVSSSTAPWGTMWVFSSSRRDFSRRETKLLELVAGGISAELDRQRLLCENERLRKEQSPWEADPWPSGARTPRITPLVEGWEIAAAGSDEEVHGGELCEWFVHEQGEFSLSVARAHDDGFRGALTIASIGGALRAHREHVDAPGELAQRINRALWAGSTGDQWSSLFHGTIRPETGAMSFTCAGPVTALVLRPGECSAVPRDSVALGVEPTTEYESCRHWIQPGESLLLATQNPDSTSPDDIAIAGRGIANQLASRPHLSAQRMVDSWRDQRQPFNTDGGTVLVAKRMR